MTDKKRHDEDERLEREDVNETATPPHGEPLLERNMEKIAEANLPKADPSSRDEAVPQERSKDKA